VERQEHRVGADVGAQLCAAAHDAAFVGQLHPGAVGETEPFGGRRMHLHARLRLGVGEFGHPPGLGAGLVVLEQPAGDEGERTPGLRRSRNGARRHGDDARQAVLVREALQEQPRGAAGAGRVGPVGRLARVEQGVVETGVVGGAARRGPAEFVEDLAGLGAVDPGGGQAPGQLLEDPQFALHPGRRGDRTAAAENPALERGHGALFLGPLGDG